MYEIVHNCVCLFLECYEYSEAVFVPFSVMSADGTVEEMRNDQCVMGISLLPVSFKTADPGEFPHMVRPNFLLTL